jgi:hypothetical protein
MKSSVRLLFALPLSLFLLGCNPAEKESRKWYKGNLHTHSYWSDGDEYPEMIMDWYKSNSYDFVALSDHNILAEGEKWITVAKSRMYEDGFNKYLEKYGDKWVTHNTDTGRINVRLKTYDEYKPLFEDENFLIIKSEEVTGKFGDSPIHMNVTNIRNVIQPQEGTSVTEVMQRNVDEVLKQRQETGVPMFPHINHPNFFYGITYQDIIGLRGERFFEVYNGHPLVHNYGDSLHPGTESMWDLINIAYSNRNQPLLLGLATDDSHNYHQFGSAYSNAGRGWVMVHADSLTPESLINAMEAGEFYSSTGVTFKDVTFTDNKLSLHVDAEEGTTYIIEFIGVKKDGQESEVLEKFRGTEANFAVTENYLFVRCRVTSDKRKTNPFQEGEYEMAWTQPVVYGKK